MWITRNLWIPSNIFVEDNYDLEEEKDIYNFFYQARKAYQYQRFFEK